MLCNLQAGPPVCVAVALPLHARARKMLAWIERAPLLIQIKIRNKVLSLIITTPQKIVMVKEKTRPSLPQKPTKVLEKLRRAEILTLPTLLL